MDKEARHLESSRVNGLFVSHSLLVFLTQWLDLLSTGKMVGENGLGYEGMKVAKDWILANPDGLEILKIVVIPASIVVITAVAHVKFTEKGGEYQHKHFEYIPFKFLRLLNAFMMVVILINVFAAELSEISQNNPMYPFIKEMMVLYSRLQTGY